MPNLMFRRPSAESGCRIDCLTLTLAVVAVVAAAVVAAVVVIA